MVPTDDLPELLSELNVTLASPEVVLEALASSFFACLLAGFVVFWDCFSNFSMSDFNIMVSFCLKADFKIVTWHHGREVQPSGIWIKETLQTKQPTHAATHQPMEWCMQAMEARLGWKTLWVATQRPISWLYSGFCTLWVIYIQFVLVARPNLCRLSKRGIQCEQLQLEATVPHPPSWLSCVTSNLSQGQGVCISVGNWLEQAGARNGGYHVLLADLLDDMTFQSMVMFSHLIWTGSESFESRTVSKPVYPRWFLYLIDVTML